MQEKLEKILGFNSMEVEGYRSPLKIYRKEASNGKH